MKILKSLAVTAGILFFIILLGLVITGWKVGWGPFDFLRFNRKAISVAEYEYAYRVETKYCKNEKKQIFGTMYIPEDGKDKRGIVILSHGFNSSSTKIALWQDLLQSQDLQYMPMILLGVPLKEKVMVKPRKCQL